MRKRPVRVLSIGMAIALLGILLEGISAPARASGGDPRRQQLSQTQSLEPAYAPDQVIVKFQPGLSTSRVEELKAAAGVDSTLDTVRRGDGENIYLYKLAPGIDLQGALAEFRSSTEVAYAEPNYLRQPAYTPNDPQFPNQWALNNTGQIIRSQAGTPDADMDAKEAWDLEMGYSNPTVVAVLDSGIDLDHPDLKQKLWKNADEIPGNGVDDDGNGITDDYDGYNWAGISQNVWNGSWMLGADTDTQVFAQAITGTGCDITAFGMLLSTVGSPTESITYSVRSDLNGAPLATASFTAAEVFATPMVIGRPLSNPVRLEAGTTYYLGIETAQNDASNYYALYDAAPDPHFPDHYTEGMEWRLQPSLGVWTGYTTYDLYFDTSANGVPHDDQGHGTGCSGLLGAITNNSTGVAGVCPGATIMPLKVYGSAGGIHDMNWINAVYYAANNGADIISMSLLAEGPSAAAQDAIDYAYARGATLFAAVGNTGDAAMQYPAGCNHVIGVGATDNRDQVAGYSTHNSSVDVSAPAVGTMTTAPTYPVSEGLGTNYVEFDGTSAACPVAAGLGALVHSRNPAYTPDQIEQVIEQSADDKGAPGRDDYYGWGRINAYRALTAMQPEVNTFYFAEGYTGAGFQEYLCLGNPNPTPASAVITYLFNGGASTHDSVTIPANSRTTVDVNGRAGAGKEVSLKVQSASQIIAERPMYFSYNGLTGGSDAVGATFASSSFYFAEGYTGAGFDEYITVLNPGSSTAHLTFRFQTQEAGEIVKTGQVAAAGSRVTFRVNDLLGSGFQTSLKLESDMPVVAERPMYFDYLGATGDKHWTGGHCVMGAPALAKSYLFAEGNTLATFDEYLTLQNPSAARITVNAVYQMGAGQGEPVHTAYTIDAGRRLTVYVPGETGGGKDVSVSLTSSSDFLAERPMYFDYLGWTGGHCVIGAPAGTTEWFFAEGCTSPTFHEYLCLQNPGSSNAQVEITYLTQEAGALPAQTTTVPANSRITVPVNASCGGNYSLSARIRVTSGPGIIAERPMYFDYLGWNGGHDVVGFCP